MSEQAFSSPVSKLLPFFQESRDGWKAKCKAAKKEVKSLKVRLAKMKSSRDRWKQKSKQPAEDQTLDEGIDLSPTKKSTRAGLAADIAPAGRGNRVASTVDRAGKPRVVDARGGTSL
jgi:hypothetical protein